MLAGISPRWCGRSSEVERQLPKLNVGGSIPPARSSQFSNHEMFRETLVLGGAFGVLKAANAQAQFLLFVHFSLTSP
jgi:hypothetical protein